jgi:hypothetical protein
MWREATKHQGERNDLRSNPTEVKRNDRGKAYTLDRLKREAVPIACMAGRGELNTPLFYPQQPDRQPRRCETWLRRPLRDRDGSAWPRYGIAV